jgi:hypothetical protein
MAKLSRFSLPFGLVLVVGLAPSTVRAFNPPARHLQEFTNSVEPVSHPAGTPVPGQTTTLLPDGSQLLLGGMGESGPLADASVKPPAVITPFFYGTP